MDDLGYHRGMSISLARPPEAMLLRRDALLRAVTSAAGLLSGAKQWERVVPEVLCLLGAAACIDRVYIFQVDEGVDVVRVSQRYEWCAPGVAPQIDNPDLQSVPLEAAGFARWIALLGAGEPVFGDIGDFPASERSLLKAQEIQSLLVQPIFEGTRWWGFLGLDACATLQSWERYEVDQLRIVSLLLGLAIHRQRHQDRLLGAQRLEALGFMAAGVAHDFNNVLGVISATVRLMQRGSSLTGARAPAGDECSAMVDQAIERARSLTRRLMDFSRRRKRELKVVSPLELMALEEPLLRGSLGPGVRLRIVSGGNGRAIAPVRIDPTELAQLLLNVAVNARDAMPRGGEFVFEVSTVEAGEHQPAADELPEGRWTLIRAIDSGMGMLPEVIGHLFEPFYTTKTDGRGTGLGLATVRTIMESAGGHIRVSSAPGCGTEFRFYLPAAGGAEPDRPRQSSDKAVSTEVRCPGAG